MSTVGTLYDETVKFGFARLLQVQTAANSSSLDFVSPLSDAYDVYHFDLINIKNGTDGSVLRVQMSINSGSTWDSTAGNYQFGMQYSFMTGTAPFGRGYGSSSTYNHFQPSAYAQYSGNPACGEFILYRMPSSVSSYRPVMSHIGSRDFTVNINTTVLMGEYVGSAPTGVRFFYSTGVIASGIIRCYGMKLGT